MTNRLTSPLKRAERTCALVGLAGNPEIELDLIEWDYGDYDGLTSERCASAIVTPASPADRFGSSSYVRRLKHVVPRSDALQPSLHLLVPQTGSVAPHTCDG